jgi:hypothetical protein
MEAALAVWASRPWLGGDSQFYLMLGDNLWRGCFGVVHAGVCQADALRPPGYPLILAFQIDGLHFTPAAIATFQAALYLGSIRLIEAMLRRLGIDPIPFLALALIYPFGLIYSVYLMTEAWALLAFCACAWLVVARKPNLATSIALGLIAGWAALIRSDLLLLPLVLAALVCVGGWGRHERARAVGLGAVVVLSAAILVLPYAVWNEQHFGKPSPAPVASAVGNTLYLAFWQSELSHDDLDGLYHGRVTARVQATGLVSEMARLNRSIGAPSNIVPFNPAAYSQQQKQIRSTEVFGRAAFAHIKAQPADYLRHVAANVWLLWNTSIYPSTLPKPAQLALRVLSAAVFVLGMLGLIVALRSSQRREFVPAAILLLYLPAIHIWLHTEARYTAAARPLLLMFAGVFLSSCLKRKPFTVSGVSVPPNGEKAQDNVGDSWFITRW